MRFRNQNLLVFPNVFAIWTHHLAVGHDLQTPRVHLAGAALFFVSSKQEYFERFNVMESFMQCFCSPTSGCTRFSHRSSASRFFTYLRFSTFLFITALIPTIFIGMDSSASAEDNGELKELPRAVLKHTPPLFKEWTFEKHAPAIFPPGFASETLGDAPPGSWEIVTHENAPSRTHALLQSARCSHSPCFQLLISENIRMEYGDFSVRILLKLGTQNSGALLSPLSSKNPTSTNKRARKKTSPSSISQIFASDGTVCLVFSSRSCSRCARSSGCSA